MGYLSGKERFRQSYRVASSAPAAKTSFRFGLVLCDGVAAMEKNHTQNITKLEQDPADHRTRKSIDIRGRVRH